MPHLWSVKVYSCVDVSKIGLLCVTFGELVTHLYIYFSLIRQMSLSRPTYTSSKADAHVATYCLGQGLTKYLSYRVKTLLTQVNVFFF